MRKNIPAKYITRTSFPRSHFPSSQLHLHTANELSFEPVLNSMHLSYNKDFFLLHAVHLGTEKSEMPRNPTDVILVTRKYFLTFQRQL